jgi:1-deoxy-D-xylulose-5-phosphate reductoisomerase
MIRLRSGAVYAELSRPDMRLSIHGALYWPEVKPAAFGRLDFDCLTLEFKKPDMERFPMLGLAYEALRRGGTYPCVYNAANEVAVAAFLKHEIGFLEIGRITGYVLGGDWKDGAADIASVLETDTAARAMAASYIKRG